MRGLDTGTQDRNPLPQSESQAPLGLDFYGTPAERLQRVVEFSGEATVGFYIFVLTPAQLRDAFQHLPPKPTADKLVAFFFAKVNHVRYPIDERLFRQGGCARHTRGITPSLTDPQPMMQCTNHERQCRPVCSGCHLCLPCLRLRRGSSRTSGPGPRSSGACRV